MATRTLVENANRIATALGDIKDAIVSKGQTPSGNCETYADAIRAISGGGGGGITSQNVTVQLSYISSTSSSFKISFDIVSSTCVFMNFMATATDPDDGTEYTYTFNWTNLDSVEVKDLKVKWGSSSSLATPTITKTATGYHVEYGYTSNIRWKPLGGKTIKVWFG